jgi:hypothetical protein
LTMLVESVFLLTLIERRIVDQVQLNENTITNGV